MKMPNVIISKHIMFGSHCTIGRKPAQMKGVWNGSLGKEGEMPPQMPPQSKGI